MKHITLLALVRLCLPLALAFLQMATTTPQSNNPSTKNGSESMNLTEVASQAIAADQADIGDSWTFELTLDLPGVAAEDSKDLRVEIFGLDPTGGVFGFHICQEKTVAVEAIGPKVSHSADHPVYIDQMNVRFPSIVEKSIIIMEHLYTASNNSSSKDESRIQIQFQAILLNLDDDQNSLKSGEEYYISAGAEFGELLLVCQAQISTVLIPNDYEPNIVLYTTPEHARIKKGDSVLFRLEAYVTAPLADIELGIMQPMGYNDVFHIGEVQSEVGNAFACNSDHLKARYTRSPSGATVNNATLSFPSLVNRDATRDISKDINKLTFNIPVYVPNMESAEVESTRLLRFSLRVGGNPLWQNLHEVTIGENVAPAENLGTPTLAGMCPLIDNNGIFHAELLNDVPNANAFLDDFDERPTLMPGMSVVYRVHVSIPSGWSNFQVRFGGNIDEHVTPVGGRISRTGLVAYFPPEIWVKNQGILSKEGVDRSYIEYYYGIVNNVGSSSTTVELELSFKIHPTAPPMNVTTLWAVMNNGTVELGVSDNYFHIGKNPAPDPITVERIAYDWPEPQSSDSGTKTLFGAGTAAMDLRITVPPTAGDADLVLAAVPDFEQTSVDLEICALRIHSVGEGLTCMQHKSASATTELFKSSSGRNFDDGGAITIGDVCPFSRSGSISGVEAHQFTATLYYRNPFGQKDDPDYGAVGQDVYIGAGLSLGDVTVWSTVEKYTYDENLQKRTMGITYSSESTKEQPFMSLYPIMNSGRRGGEFRAHEGFFVQTIVKLPPQSQGQYKLHYWESGSNDSNAYTGIVRPCKVEVVHVGDNLPCMAIPKSDGGSPRDTIRIEMPHEVGIGTRVIVGNDFDSRCGHDAAAYFDSATNYGRGPIVPDLTPDSDSILVMAYFQICDLNAASTEVYLNYLLEALSDHTGALGHSYSQTTSMRVLLDPMSPIEESDGLIISSLKASSVGGQEEVLFTMMANIIEIKVQVPNGYWGDLEIIVWNSHYDDDVPIDLCGMSVISVGNNMPCLDVTTQVAHDERAIDSKTLPDGRTMRRGMSIVLKGVCYIHADQREDAKSITLEMAVRLPNDINETMAAKSLKNISLLVQAVPVTPQLATNFTLTFDVLEPTGANVSLPPVTPSEANVVVDPTESNAMITGARAWVDFSINVPLGKTTPLSVAVLAPVEQNRSIATVTRLGFGRPPGAGNVLCANPSVDLQSTYSTKLEKTERLATFMQIDSATADLGYITNGGWSTKWGAYEPRDDLFVLSAEMEMSDHPLTRHNEKFDVLMAVKYDDVIVVASHVITSVRPTAGGPLGYNVTMEDHVQSDTYRRSRYDEEPKIRVDVFTIDNTSTFNVNDTVEVFAVIRHDRQSQGEAFPGIIRVFTPNYLTFVHDVNHIESNYTRDGLQLQYHWHNNTCISNCSHTVDHFDIEFAQGITYPDIITLNFSLTLDSLGTVLVGSGLRTAAVVLQPLCVVSDFPDLNGDPYPGVTIDSDDFISCGSPAGAEIEFEAPDCDEPIPIFYPDCQIRASDQISSETRPANSIREAEEQVVWSPPMRGGHDARVHYLEFDFLSRARITALAIKAKWSRYPLKVRVLSSDGPTMGLWTEVKGEASTLTTISFEDPIEARFMRIELHSLHDAGAVADFPISTSGVEWSGCLPNEPVPGTTVDESLCFSSTTVDSTDPTSYRHFAVDDDNGILYFCDRNGYLNGEMLCYATNLSQDSKGSYLWKPLPRHIGHIVGYSPTKHRMYFKDKGGKAILSSMDGVVLDIADTVAADVINAVPVPGKARADIGEIPWIGARTEYKATFFGIFKESTRLIMWSSCCN